MPSPRLPALLPAALALLLSAPAEAQELRYAEDQAPGIVNPLFTTTMSEARLAELVFEGLFTDDADLATVGLLAQSAVLAPDGLSMDIQLRPGVKWHDGRPLTADDVVFTIEAMKNPATLSPEIGRVDWIRSASARGGDKVHLEFLRPELSPQDKLSFKILPKHRFSGTAVQRGDRFRTAPVGTGPYELVQFNDDNSVSLKRYEGYRGEVGLPAVTLREVSDKNYQAKLLLYESLEALVRVLPRDLAILQSSREASLYPYQTNSWWYVGMNLDSLALSEVGVRQALSQLVDVPALLAPVGTGEVLSGPFVPSSPYYNHQVEPWGRSPAEASRLLQAAGYQRDAEGWKRDGEPLVLRLVAPRGLESAQEVVINLQSQLQGQGVRIQVDFVDDATWRKRIWQDRDYDLLLSQWSFDRNEDVREQLHSRGSRNFGAYQSEAVDALLDRARDSRDPQEKKALLRELHQVVHDDAPVIFLWTLDSYSAMSVKVRSVTVHPFYFFTWVRDWRMQ